MFGLTFRGRENFAISEKIHLRDRWHLSWDNKVNLSEGHAHNKFVFRYISRQYFQNDKNRRPIFPPLYSGESKNFQFGCGQIFLQNRLWVTILADIYVITLRHVIFGGELTTMSVTYCEMYTICCNVGRCVYNIEHEIDNRGAMIGRRLSNQNIFNKPPFCYVTMWYELRKFDTDSLDQGVKICRKENYEIYWFLWHLGLWSSWRLKCKASVILFDI